MKFIVQRQPGSGKQAAQVTRSVKVIDADLLEIGRGAGCALRSDDKSVSRQHAVIQAGEQGFVLVDQGSLTGTWVNGERISRHQIENGDLLVIGRETILLEQTGSEAPLQLTVLAPEADAEALAEQARTKAMAPASPPPPPTEAPRPAEPEVGETQLPAAAPPPVEEAAPRSEPTPPPAGVAAPPRGPRVAPGGLVKPVDYASAYGLDRGYLTKATLAAVAGAIALAAVALGALGGRTDLVSPGPISRAHQIISSADNCSSCHTPFSGVDSQSCECCHTGPEHVATQTRTPDCQECHVEHRFQPVLHLTEDRSCVSCHRDLEVEEGAQLQYEAQITDFKKSHPEFKVSVGPVLAADAPARPRVAIAEAIASKIDPAQLAFNHRLHLDPAELKGEQLTCASCHLESPDEKRMLLVNYEDHCQSCHQLNFDQDYDPAPHDESVRVYEHILASYALSRSRGTTRTTPRRRAPQQSSRLIRKSLIFNKKQVTITYDEQTERSAFSAADRMFKGACDKCHELVEWDSWPQTPPKVTATQLSTRFLPLSEFPHERHNIVQCEACHSAAPNSTETADVLIEGIETCRPCHGGVRSGDNVPAALQEARGSATTDCASCHLYHDQTKKQQGWEARRSCQQTDSTAQGAVRPPHWMTLTWMTQSEAAAVGPGG